VAHLALLGPLLELDAQLGEPVRLLLLRSTHTR